MTRRPILWLLVVLAVLSGWLAYDRGRDQVTSTAVAPASDEPALAPASPPATVEAEVAEGAPAAAAVTPHAALEADRASERPATEERTEARATARAAGEAERLGETLAPTTGVAVVARSSPTTAVAPAPARETPAEAPAAEPQLPSTQAVPSAGLAAESPAAAAIERPDHAATERGRSIEQRVETTLSSPDAAPPLDHGPAAPGAAEERPLEWSRLGSITPGAGPTTLPPTATLPDRPQEPPTTGAAATASTAEVGSRMPSEGRDDAADRDPEQRQAALEVAPAAPEPAAGTAAEGASPGGPSPAVAEPPEGTSDPGATADDQPEPPAVSLMVDSIKRALAAMLGGPPKVSEMVPADVVDPPKGVPAATETRTPRVPGQDAETPAAGATEPVRPSFDIVRVERDGRAVIAGRAAPGAEIELRSGDDVIDRVRASARGEWVSAPLEALAPGASELTAVARERAAAPLLEAEQVVVVALPEPPPPQPAEVRTAGPPPPQPAEVAKAGADPVAVLLPKDERGTGRVLQAPGRISSEGQLALLVLDYDQAGQIRLTGEAPPGAPVRVYVDNQPSGEFLVEPDGKWSTLLDRQLPPGDYTLRLDQLGTEGRPVARLETPFTRVRQPPVAGQAQVDYVVVQPGNSLWRIARRLFGEGFRYVHIYDANRAQIRDPDLIYPGQVFEVPAALGTAG